MTTQKQKTARDKMRKVAQMWRNKSEKYRKTHKYTAFVKKHLKKKTRKKKQN